MRIRCKYKTWKWERCVFHKVPSDNTFLKLTHSINTTWGSHSALMSHAGDSLTHQGLRVDLHQTIIHAHFIFLFTRLACYQIGSRGDRSGRRPRSAFDANQRAATVFNVLLLQLPNLHITSSAGRYSMCYLNKLQGRADWMNVFTLFFLSWRIATLQLTAWRMQSVCQKRTTASSMRYS